MGLLTVFVFAAVAKCMREPLNMKVASTELMHKTNMFGARRRYVPTWGLPPHARWARGPPYPKYGYTPVGSRRDPYGYL
jgi:hypothetical protein